MKRLFVLIILLIAVAGCSLQHRYVGRKFEVPHYFATVLRNSLKTVHAESCHGAFCFKYSVQSLGNDQYLLKGTAELENKQGVDRFTNTDVVFIIVRDSTIIDSISFPLKGQTVKHSTFSKTFTVDRDIFFIGPGSWSYIGRG